VSALLDADEIARRLCVSRATAYREMRNMPHVVVGKRALRVSELAFDAYLRRRTQDPRKVHSPRTVPSDRAIQPVRPRTKPVANPTKPISEPG
jgi:hypothetical protein